MRSFFLAAMCSVMVSSALAQPAGSILFSTAQADSAFLSEYHFTNQSNLFVTVSLEKPLTQYLNELAPELSTDSLVKVGNYQFSFYVDGKMVYKTNLLPGAPRPAFQQTETKWTKPFIDHVNEGGLWSQSAWERFMFNGGDSALSDRNHELTLEFRPYLQLKKLMVGNIIAKGKLQLQVQRQPVIDLKNTKLSPVTPYPGFAVSKEKFDRDTLVRLKANIDADVFRHITSVVIIKNGKLLVEEYFNGATRISLHDVRSVGKSFASTLAGIAKRDGFLKSEEQTLKDFYDMSHYEHYSERKAEVTLKDLLTMSSVFDGDDSDPHSIGNEENMYPTDNWEKFVLNLPVDTNKYHGQWHYFTGGAMLLGHVLDKLVPGGLEAYADSNLFRPLGIRNYNWQHTPQNVVNTAGGIKMNALDFAKYGQLYKNGGTWNGTRILPASWVKQSFTKHEAVTGRANEFYGYLFWNKKYVVNKKNYECFYSAGNGGNKIFIFRDQPLVIVVTATAYGALYAHPQVDKMMEKYLLPAVIQ